MTTNDPGHARSGWLPGVVNGAAGLNLGLRRLRLAACGCCRAAWPRLEPACRLAVRSAERYADGHATAAELGHFWRSCRQAERRPDRSGRHLPTEEVHRVAGPVVTLADIHAVAADLRPWRGDCIENEEIDALCGAVIRDVLGGPPCPPARLAEWRTPSVVSLAGAAYRSREFSLLPRLGDALDAAGCDDAVVLGHCHGPGPHARGCWLLDLLR